MALREDQDFTTLTRLRLVEPGRYAGEIADGWQQGRGAFGGLVTGLLARAIEAAAGDAERRLRSLTAELPGPAQPGPIEIVVETLRAGSGASTLAARLVQDGQVQAHAVGVVGKPREGSPSWQDAEPPAWPDGVTEFDSSMAAFAPRFARHLAFGVAAPFPFTDGPLAEALGTVRFRNPGPGRDAAWLAGVADAWWPSAFTRMSAPRPMATIAYTLQVHQDPATLDPAEPLLHRARGLAAEGGYFAELRELWDRRGRLVATNQQTFAIIK